jgi:hypothetical protein
MVFFLVLQVVLQVYYFLYLLKILEGLNQNKNTISDLIIVIYSKSEEGKAFVHANCNAIKVNESGLTLDCCTYLVLFNTSLESESVTLYSKF